MEGGFFDELRQLEFFPGAEKQPHSCVPVVSSAAQLSNSDPTSEGIYQDEESVDLSALLESCNSDHSASSRTTVVSSAVITDTVSSENSAAYQNTTAPGSNFDTFPGYLSSNLARPSMYDQESFASHHVLGNHMDVAPNSPSSMVMDHSSSSQQHVVQIDDTSGYANVPNHPAPGKSPRSKSAKKNVDKKSDEYRVKRNRNNVAVRKSREKSRVRVLSTEKRVKELEDENGRLQSKITLLTKELNVLKSLFTSAGVTQPPHFSAKIKGVVQK